MWRIGTFNLTYACDFRCLYCSDGAGRPYFELKSTVLRGSAPMALLRIIRRYCDYLVLTGGEPLLHPDFEVLARQIRGLGFDGIVLTTNGHTIEKHLKAVAAAVDYLVFSLDTLDPERGDRWFGVGPGVLQKVLANIERAASVPGRRYEIIISSVAKPDNLEDLYAVYRYSQERGFRFAVCPQLQGVKPHPELFENPGYQRLFDDLIQEKKKGRAVHGSLLYLEHMRDLKKFSCRPSTVLAISPAGDVFYPCLEIGHVAGNLLENPDLNRLREEGRRLFGPEPSCDNRCQSACALGFSLILNRPLSLVDEVGRMVRAASRRWSDRLAPRH